MSDESAKSTPASKPEELSNDELNKVTRGDNGTPSNVAVGIAMSGAGTFVKPKQPNMN